MAQKKRELVAEKWLELTEYNIEQRKQLGLMKFLKAHMDAGHDLEMVVFEQDMAKAWRRCGLQVYEFDPDFSESILDEKWAELLPEVIQYRPHDCFYMKLPYDDMNEGVVLYVVSVENVSTFEDKYFPGARDSVGIHYGGVPGKGERALVNTGDELLCLCPFPIPKNIDLMFDDTPLGWYPTNLLLNGLAYLCSANADIAAVYTPRKEKRRNNAKKRSQATWHEVGYRIGAQLRNYNRQKSERGEKTGRKVRPHMRRAHWHRFWIGPRDGERRLVLKWVAATMVGVDIENATLHRVG